MNDEFEQRLSRQPQKEIPSAWRREILAAARTVQISPLLRADSRRSWLSTLNTQLSSIFWPHPKAWAGLAAIWIFIFVLNFSMRDQSPMVAEKSAPPSPEMMVQLKKQRLMFAELMGSTVTPDADRRKFSPKPRSERVEILVG